MDKEAFRKTWMAKYTLRSHFDSVRALAFHPVEPVLITASEDHTLKMWNLQKTVSAKKLVKLQCLFACWLTRTSICSLYFNWINFCSNRNASLDVEPLYTFRQHTGPVMCLLMSTSGEHVYSSSLDGTINVWKVPDSNIDPYDSYGEW